MGAAERCKDQLSAVRRTLIDVHSGDTLINLNDLRHIGEVQLRIHALRIHVQCQRDNIHITGALAVAEQGALDTVAARQQSQLAVCHCTAAVVVGMQGDDNVFSAVEIVVHVLDLVGVDMGHGVGNRYRQVDDHLVVRRRLPDLQHGVADLQRKLRLCSGEALRRILKAEMTLGLFPILLAEFCAKLCDLDDIFLALLKHLFPLCHGGGVIQVDDGMLCALQGFKGLGDDVFPCLRQHLNRYIVRNQILFDQRPAELVFRFGCSRKADLDFLESDLHQILEKLQFFLQTHGRNQCLIAVPQVNAAPDRCFFDHGLLCPAHGRVLHRKKLRCILFYMVHHNASFLSFSELVLYLFICGFLRMILSVTRKKSAGILSYGKDF